MDIDYVLVLYSKNLSAIDQVVGIIIRSFVTIHIPQVGPHKKWCSPYREHHCSGEGGAHDKNLKFEVSYLKSCLMILGNMQKYKTT